MKISIRALTLFLVFALVLPCISLVACSQTGDDPDDTTDETEAPEEFSFSGYTLVYPKRCTDTVEENAKKLYDALAAIFPDMKIANDDVEETEKEILFGKTKREISQTLTDKCDKYDYDIHFEGEKMIVVGGGNVAITRATDDFICRYVFEDNYKLLRSDLNMNYKYTPINNASLMPAYVEDDKVGLVSVEPDGGGMAPDWINGMIMMEVQIATATPEGTFESAIKVLDHCAEMGITGLWLCPIYERGNGGNGYGNQGPHLVDHKLTGTTDQEEGWKVVKNFVDEAHKRNIRIILDIITWGVMRGADLINEHPDWFAGEQWGNIGFNWKNDELNDWFVDVCIENIMKTGADGYRCDCEPNYTGYKVFNRVKEGCYKQGKNILIMSEDGSKRRDTYDTEQDGVLYYKECDRGSQYQNPRKWYIDVLDIVDSVKEGIGIGAASLQNNKNTRGTYRYYTFCVSNHDYQRSITNGNRLVIGYQAIFAPFIPLWYMGAEMGQRAENVVIYDRPVDWGCLNDPKNMMFYEDVKKYLQIRLTYPEIFAYYPENHRDSNICRVTASNTKLTAYARYAGGKAILVVPNNSGATIKSEINIPYAEAGLSENAKVTDLLTGESIEVADGSFKSVIKDQYMGIFLVE